MQRFFFARSITLFILFIAFLGLSIEGAGDDKGMGQAEVSVDIQKAFAEASSSSNLVYLLKRGEVVTIILRITTSGDVWCRIVLPGQGGLTGYVPCKALTSASTSSGTPVSAPNEVQPPPAVAVRTDQLFRRIVRVRCTHLDRGEFL